MKEGKIIQKSTTFQNIYPYTERLSSRHMRTFNNIKHKFEQIYSNQPNWFIISKGICQLEYFDGRKQNSQGKYRFSMAIQNGTIIAIKQTQIMGNIYISSNRWQDKSQQVPLEGSQYADQLILDFKGKVQQCRNTSEEDKTLSKYLGQLYECAIQDISVNKIKGAIMYIMNGLGKNTFYEQQSMLYAFYLSILKINNLIQEYDVNHIIMAIRRWGISNKYPFNDRLQKYEQIFYYENNTIQINRQYYLFQNGSTNIKRFILFKLPPNQKNIFHKDKTESLSLFQILEINCKNRIPNNSLSQVQKLEEFMAQNKNRLQNQLKKYAQNKEYNNYGNTILSIIRNCEGVLYQNNYEYFICLVSANYAEIICKISKQINKYTKKEQQTQKDILQQKQQKYERNMNKWGRNPQISVLVFSSLPSVGISIMDPFTQIGLI